MQNTLCILGALEVQDSSTRGASLHFIGLDLGKVDALGGVPDIMIMLDLDSSTTMIKDLGGY